MLKKHLLLSVLNCFANSYFCGNCDTLPFKIKKVYFIQRGCIKSIKSDSKDFYNVTKDFHFK